MPLVSDGLLFGSLTDKQKEGVLDLVGDLALQRFEAYVNAIEGAFKFRDPKGTFQKLALYRSRPQDEWAKLQSVSPMDFEKQLKDWLYMEHRQQFNNLNPRQSVSSTSPLPVQDNY